MEVSLYATLTFKICHNHIYLYRNHPSPSTATCRPKKHIERTLLSSDYSLSVCHNKIAFPN